MGTQKTRRNKIAWFKDQIFFFFKSNSHGEINTQRLLNEFAFKHASTLRTGKEILKQVCDELDLNYNCVFIKRK